MREAVIVGYVAGRFDRKVILPIASLVLAAMLTLAGVVGWTAAVYDRAALRDETRLLQTALEARLKAEGEMLYDYAFWDEAYQRLHLAPDPGWARENIVDWARERLGVAMTFVLGPDGRTWLGAVEGAATDGEARSVLGESAWAFADGVRQAAPDRAQAAYARVGGRLAVVSAAPVGTHTDHIARSPGPASAIVQVDFLDAENLSELARTYLLPELRPLAETDADAPDAGPRYVVADREGRPVAALTWRTAAPGRELLARALPIFGLATLGLGVLTWVVLRHARDAAATIAVSAEQASHDPLTGLPNRRLFDHRLAAALARPRAGRRDLALLYLDLDGFKPVNDRFGHEAGDELLREAARRLRALTRAGDVPARVGGDEFVVLQAGGAQPAGAARLAEALLDALRRPIRLGAAEARVGASIGVALATPDVDSPRELIRRADAALYAAKRTGRGTYRIFAADPGRPLADGGDPAGASRVDDPVVAAGR